MTYGPLLITLAALAVTPVRAQYGYYGDNGTSYGVRIGVGVGIAVAVALVILIVGVLLRRRRARAFKSTFPLHPQGGQAQQQQPQGYYGQQYHGGPPQPQYGQSYTSQPASSPAVATGNYDQPPPQYAGYHPDTTSHYSPQMGAAPTSGGNLYAPPNSPPPAATSQTAYYPPPSGPPPTSNGKVV
ncbi:hypothetical protein JCM10908_005980 [Rhodotorula pacifica]|uniref:uncharacterized protein n=1 Tax=Rhodotorula pacifica TaxID=1495444 RepID=UPI0031756E96